MPNRLKQPPISQIGRLFLPQPETYTLQNGVPMHVIRAGKHEVVKLEIVFRAGRPYEQQQLVSRSTNVLLREGSKHYSNAEIAETLDFYGCTLITPYNIDVSTLTLHSPSKHLDKILPIIGDLLHQPLFPEKELATYALNNKQRLAVELSKADTVAYRTITELIFGNTHPYGYNSTPEVYAGVNRANLVNHFHRTYNTGNAQIFLSGHVSEKMIKSVDQILSASILAGEKISADLPIIETSPQKISIQQQNSLQTAIRIGKRLFNRHHEDYIDFYLLNMILGGYFGSRLMANIREEQGYTYNIHSSLDPMCYDGGFYITTEVSRDKLEDTVEQIHKEIELLKTELISEEELEMVKNYTLGYFLTMIDGTFNVAEMVKNLYIDALPLNYFDNMVKRIQQIRPERIQELAKKYLKRDQFWQVSVGPS